LNVHIFTTIVHIVACVILILVILLQAGKGASMGAAFGGSSQTVFGSSGPASFLGKMTTGIAILFMFTSLGLSYMAVHKGKSVMDTTSRPAVETKAPQALPQQPSPTQSGGPISGQAGQPAQATPTPAK
jgi:preprotein translocase subunit SecG